MSKEEKQPVTASTPGDRLRRELLSWLWVIIAFILIEGTVVQARVIPSGSMENTLLIGDHLLVSRLGYDAGIPFTDIHVPLWRNPGRQQIIVFKAPLPGSQDFVKRVIGLPGDRVEFRDGVVYVNGQRLNEPYLQGEQPSAENRPPIVVPPDCYFVLGDNRDNSYDSRYWGFVPRSALIGSPLIIYMSIDGPSEAWEPGHLGERLVTYAHALIHPSEVRWKRLFTIFH